MANLSSVRRVRHKKTKREVHNEINNDNALLDDLPKTNL
jgi:hypothetical protein